MKVEDIKNLKGVESHSHGPELQALIDYIDKSGKKPLVVEIGSYCGASAIAMAEAAKAGKVICVDPFVGKHRKNNSKNLTETLFRKNVLKKYKNVTLLKMTSEKASIELWKAEAKFGITTKVIDFLFIDGNHEDEFIALDCKLWLPKVKPGGFVAFHDYNNVAFTGVRKAVDENTQGWEQVDSIWDMIVKKKPL